MRTWRGLSIFAAVNVPTLVWLVTTDEQCAKAAEQALLWKEWVVQQVRAGQPSPRGLPRGATLPVATRVPPDPDMALHALEDQFEDAGHLVVHQRGGPAWLREYKTALRSWVSTVAAAEVWFHDHPAACPDSMLALVMDQLPPPRPRRPVALRGPQCGGAQPHWVLLAPRGLRPHILRCVRERAMQASHGRRPCGHLCPHAGTVPDREGMPASLPLQYGTYRSWVHTVDAEVIVQLLPHANH